MAGIRNTDVFAAGNLLLFVGWNLFVLLDGRGVVGSLLEFWIYAASIALVIIQFGRSGRMRHEVADLALTRRSS